MIEASQRASNWGNHSPRRCLALHDWYVSNKGGSNSPGSTPIHFHPLFPRTHDYKNGPLVDATFSYRIPCGKIFRPKVWAGFHCLIDVNPTGSRSYESKMPFINTIVLKTSPKFLTRRSKMPFINTIRRSEEGHYGTARCKARPLPRKRLHGRP